MPNTNLVVPSSQNFTSLSNPIRHEAFEHLNNDVEVKSIRRGATAFATAALVLVATGTQASSPQPYKEDESSTKRPSPKPLIKTRIVDESDLSSLNQIIYEIRTIARFNDAWHGPHSVAAAQKAIDDAERFARELTWSQKNRPKVALAEDGELNLFWKSEEIYLDVGFFGDGTYSFFGQLASGETISGDSVPARNGQATTILADLLAKL